VPISIDNNDFYVERLMLHTPKTSKLILEWQVF